MSYGDLLREGLASAYGCASKAREKGLDPASEVEVKVTADIAARVEKIVGPPGISSIIRSMEKEGISREDIAFKIAKSIANGEVIKGTKEILISQAVRTGTAILTEGVLVAPTEGIAKIKIKNNPDGSDYVAVYYAGPIRSAGGTAVALTVVLADIARRTAGIGDYRPTDTQIERYIEEVNLYEARVAHLQYKPPEEDVRWIVRNCPVCVDGEPTGDLEVSAYKSIPGVETNRIRGGIPLVLCEGIAQKAAKLFKYAKKLALGWDWLEKLIKIAQKESKTEIKPDDTYLEGLVAGRPVFSYPSTKGGFRLRYGKSRTNGLMARNIHPATMVLLDGFITYGTHVKVERPGKGCVITPYERIEPPVVRLKDGSVLRIETEETAKECLADVDKILFLGDMLVTYGDFLKSNHPLITAAWCEEWWEKELEASGVEPPAIISAEVMFQLSRTHNLPLHPRFTYHWHDISPQELKELVHWLSGALMHGEEGKVSEVVLPSTPAKKILEQLLVPHRVIKSENELEKLEKIVLESEDAVALLLSLGMLKDGKIEPQSHFDAFLSENKGALQIVNELSGIQIKAKAPFYIGARMGRPEKAKERKMDGSPNVLFPTGSQMRSIMRLYRTMKSREGEKTVKLELCRRRCPNCSSITPFSICGVCGNTTIQEYKCQKCNRIVQHPEHCEGKALPFEQQDVNIVKLVETAKAISEGLPEDIKGVKGLSNPTRIPERLEKGVLRAKHAVYVFRDGTSRFDSTNVPLTHFCPCEIGLSLEKLKELGYEKDYKGEPITRESQLIQLKQQDILISESGVDYFTRVGAFVDDLLVNLYKMKPFYNMNKKEDLIGHLCMGLSPHTSAGVLCRIIGFTRAHVGYAHPFMIAARRRNCFYPDTRVNIYKEHEHDRLHFCGAATCSDMLNETLEEISENLIRNEPQRIKKFDESSFKIDVKDKSFGVTSWDPKTDSAKRRKVKCFIKTAPPQFWIKIKTEHGREMVVTPDHNILCMESGQLKAIEAQHLKEEMIIPVESRPQRKNEPLKLSKDKIIKIEKFSDNRNAYCLDIETETEELIEKNVLLENGIFCIRCDGDEDSVMLLMDALLNFSRAYLTETRGGTMDTPLVLIPIINPKEIDDEAHCIEFINSYPLEFYRATERNVAPGDMKLKIVKDMLNEPEQCADIPITHLGGDLDSGSVRSKYIELDSIPEKITAQFKLQQRLLAVDQKNAVERLILSHFIPDLYGNLRSFYRQSFRCVGCNRIYRRPPLVGKCLACGGNLLLTINKGGIEKYLEISKKIVEEYDLPLYLKQRLELVEKEISAVFEDDKEKQMDLTDFV